MVCSTNWRQINYCSLIRILYEVEVTLSVMFKEQEILTNLGWQVKVLECANETSQHTNYFFSKSCLLSSVKSTTETHMIPSILTNG